LSTNCTALGKTPLSTNDGSGFPVPCTVKLPFDPTVKVVLLALDMPGGTSTVTVVMAVTVAGVVAALLTVNV
jgi:hypothetical protein